MSFRLVPLIKGTAPIITIHRPVLLIGRHIECDVRIEQTKISRRHCCVAMAYDRMLVRDLGSRNKIRVNGQLVEEARLEAGDELAIGPLLYRLEVIEERRDVASVPPPATKPASPPPRPVVPSPPVPAAANPPDWGEVDSDLDLIPLDDL
jgi:pSer/pThr/pTyr-binding forkhead associated (FHA) protein